ncbi:hypothetical protein BBJ28_00004275 [Nothophytophthora sp. Chile5]|nr:hypothetical protein BBJ28_00004275 [Nothophytophthora sp. Chile5]
MPPSVPNYNTATDDSVMNGVERWGSASDDGVTPPPLPGATPSSKRPKLQLWLRLGVLALLVTSATLALTLLPVRAYLVATTTWVTAHLYLGTLAVILVFWAAIPLCVPSTALEMIAGLLFGVPHAVLVIVIGKTGGSLLAFLLGRSMGKEVIGGYLRAKFPTFRAFSEVLNSASWKPVLLFQLSSIPNIVKCYSLAITHVSAARFAVSSAVGNIPHAFLWAYIGAQATDIAAILAGETEMSTSRMVMLTSGAAVTVLALTFLVVYTKRQLQELQKRECRSSSEEDFLLNIAVDAQSPCSLRSEPAMKSPSIRSPLGLHSAVLGLIPYQSG